MSHLRFGPLPSPVFPAHSDRRSPPLASFHSFPSPSCCFPRLRRRRRSISGSCSSMAKRSPLLFLPLPLLLSFSFSAQWSAISKRVFDRARVAQRVIRMPDAGGGIPFPSSSCVLPNDDVIIVSSLSHRGAAGCNFRVVHRGRWPRPFSSDRLLLLLFHSPLPPSRSRHRRAR